MALKDELKKQKKTDTSAPEVKERPRKRAPITGRNVLTVGGKDPNKHYRVVNDVGDRIEQFKERGWVVEDDENLTIGDRRVATPKGVGSPVQASVGGGVKGVVMSLPRELWEEDQAWKQANDVDTLEAATKSTKAGDYGSIKVEKG
jgi:hypothetical protein